MTNKNMYTEKNINTANTAVKDKATKKGIFIGAVAVAMVGVIAAGAMVFGVMNAPKLSKTAAPTTAISVKNDAPALTANKKSAELTKATTAPTEKITAKKATDTTAAQKKAAEVKAAQKKVEAQKAAQKKAAEKKLAEKKLAEKKLAEKKLAEKKLAEKKLAEKKLAEKKAAAQKAAAQKAAAQKAAVPTEAPTQAPTVAPTEASVKTLFKTSSTTDDTIKIVNGERVFIDTKSPVPTNSGNPYAYTAHGKTSKGGFGWDYKADSLSVLVRCDYNFDREEYNFQCFGVTPGISHVTLMYNTADDVQVPVNLTLSVDSNLNVTVLPNA